LYPEFSKFGVLQLQEETAVAAKPYLLALDGDEEVLKTIAKVAAPHFTAMVTRDPRKLLGWMENMKEVGAVLTEHVLQTASGVSLLESARTMRPGARRVLLTTYHDLSSIVAGLHSGAIERLVAKPFTEAELLFAILPEGASGAQGVADSARKRAG
jgi:ActR/RegA family two-component response regulator